MKKVEINEDTLYYKSMRLVSAGLIVQLKERSKDFQTDKYYPSEVLIHHSPAKFELEHQSIKLKDRAELRDYIAMLQDFDIRFGHYLDDILDGETPYRAEEREEQPNA